MWYRRHFVTHDLLQVNDSVKHHHHHHHPQPLTNVPITINWIPSGRFAYALHQVQRVKSICCDCFSFVCSVISHYLTRNRCRLFTFGWTANGTVQLSICKSESWHIYSSHRRHWPITFGARCHRIAIQRTGMGRHSARRKSFAWRQSWSVCAKWTARHLSTWSKEIVGKRIGILLLLYGTAFGIVAKGCDTSEYTTKIW